ncbi:hypothetical protein RF11_10927 [Thelohanellus kitauei]|uniref:Uncharacterized protein n=1 Tax=Thelohanellus kitauei TaxID=669202 RepID=A0A0C2MWK0_THEKT|nr:hypothetical protein RF11_10927 [Thelohanellus kitauei]
MSLPKFFIQAISFLRLRENHRPVSACYHDYDDPSIRVELKFMNGIPSPPPVLLMNVILKYYDLKYSGLVNAKKERYNLVICKCGMDNSFTFSYSKTDGLRIDVQILLGFQWTFFSEFRFSIIQPNDIPLLILEDIMSICVFAIRIVEHRDYVIKRHEVYRVRPRISIAENEKDSELCYVTMYNGRTFIFRLIFDKTSKRPTYPMIEFKIKISNRSNIDIYAFYQYNMVGWNVECKKHDPSALIDNPNFIYDDSIKVKIIDISDNYESFAIYVIKDSSKKSMIDSSTFNVANLNFYKFKTFQNKFKKKSRISVDNSNNIFFLHCNVAYYECTAHNMQSKLIEYTYNGIRVKSVFYHEQFVGIHDSIRIYLINDPIYINECKNNVSKTSSFLSYG